MKFKRIITSLFVLNPLIFTISSCSTSINSSLTSKAIQSNNEIIFTYSDDNSILDISPAITSLINYYNYSFKNDIDFVPVNYVFYKNLWSYLPFDNTNVSKNDEGTDTSKKIIKRSYHLNNKIDEIFSLNGNYLPSIALSNSSTALVVNKYNRLLDLSNSKIKKIFDNKILNSYNSLTLNNNNFYNIPFSVSDLDSVGFNLDNIWKVFNIVKDGGGKVDENMELYKLAKKSLKEGNSTKEYSFFNVIKPKSKTVFSELKVDLSIFKNIYKALDFSNNFISGIEIDKSKINKLKETDIEDVSLFTIDFPQNSLFKSLLSKFGKNFWSIDNKGEINWNILNDKDYQENFKYSYEKFFNKINKLGINVKGNTKYFSSFKFKNYENFDNQNYEHFDNFSLFYQKKYILQIFQNIKLLLVFFHLLIS